MQTETRCFHVYYFQSSGRVDWEQTIRRMSAGQILRAGPLAAMVTGRPNNGTRAHASRALQKMALLSWPAGPGKMKTLRRLRPGEYIVQVKEV